jgi:hypothetical protein
MPKLHASLTAPLSILIEPDIKALLIAASFYRGYRGLQGRVARDMLQDGLNHWMGGLGPADRKRFDEILLSVKVAETYRK